MNEHDEHEEIFSLTRISQIFTDCPNCFLIRDNPYNPCLSPREIEIRAAHEVIAARATQLALLIDQFMPTLWTKPPMLTGVFLKRCSTNSRFNFCVF
jgi:hypothetical protein